MFKLGANRPARPQAFNLADFNARMNARLGEQYEAARTARYMPAPQVTPNNVISPKMVVRQAAPIEFQVTGITGNKPPVREILGISGDSFTQAAKPVADAAKPATKPVAKATKTSTKKSTKSLKNIFENVIAIAKKHKGITAAAATVALAVTGGILCAKGKMENIQETKQKHN